MVGRVLPYFPVFAFLFILLSLDKNHRNVKKYVTIGKIFKRAIILEQFHPYRPIAHIHVSKRPKIYPLNRGEWDTNCVNSVRNAHIKHYSKDKRRHAVNWCKIVSLLLEKRLCESIAIVLHLLWNTKSSIRRLMYTLSDQITSYTDRRRFCWSSLLMVGEGRLLRSR